MVTVGRQGREKGGRKNQNQHNHPKGNAKLLCKNCSDGHLPKGEEIFTQEQKHRSKHQKRLKGHLPGQEEGGRKKKKQWEDAKNPRPGG